MAEADGLWPRPTGRQSSSTCCLAAVRRGHAIERGGCDGVACRRQLDADGAKAQQRQMRRHNAGAGAQVVEGVGLLAERDQAEQGAGAVKRQLAVALVAAGRVDDLLLRFRDGVHIRQRRVDGTQVGVHERGLAIGVHIRGIGGVRRSPFIRGFGGDACAGGHANRARQRRTQREPW